MTGQAMKIKKVKAASVREAMRQIRREFGSDAIILNTQNLQEIPQEDPEAKVEVTAGIYQKTPQPAEVAVASPPESPEPQPDDKSPQMQDTILKMQETIERLTVELQYPDLQRLPDAYREWYLYLTRVEIDSYLIKNMIREIRQQLGEEATSDQIRDQIEYMIDDIFLESPSPQVEEPRRIIALVGPTGVGKTTTIAKLATQKSLEEGRRVALITADTYRVAATDQIRTFANLLEVPIQVVYTAEEMARAIKDFAEYEYIYIDTTGRSQNDAESVLQIQEILEGANPHEVHLVLSATTSTATLRAIANRFSALPITDLLISKTDEAEAVGSVLSMLQQFSWPVSYFTNGQHVPEDIMVGTSTGYCELLFGDLQ